jgi:hypothetical protein
MCVFVNDNSNICGIFRECPNNHCIGLNWTIFPQSGHDSCSAGACQTYSCVAIISQFNQSCESDSDGDGVPDSQDACPQVYGLDCNGCPNPCTGCAEMLCEEGTLNIPTCFADDSECPLIQCPEDECGAEGCDSNQLADYPESVNKMCTLEGDDGICIDIACYPECEFNPLCGACGIETFGITVKTDKPVYNPENTVMISGEVLDSSCEPVIDGDVAIQVNNSTNPIYVTQVPTNGTGFYTTAFILPPETPLGLYNIFAAYDSVTNSTTFTVTSGGEQDSDGDGVLDSQDACPQVYGTACNGCPNPCIGCAKMVCTDGLAPTCAADDSKCSATICPADGCGLDGCSATQMADYPVSVQNTCGLDGNSGTCTEKSCTPTCTASDICLPHADHLVFSEVMYDGPSPEPDTEWLEIYNPTNSGMDLSGLKINNTGGSWTIPQSIMMVPGSYITIAHNATQFYNLYGCYPTVDGFTRALVNGGDALWLKNGTQIIDMVAWKDKVQGWSLFANENKTISRVPPWLDTDTAADWQNNTTPSPNPCLKMKQFSTGLKKGWNLISIPVDPPNKTIDSVLSSLAGKYTMARSFSPPSNWKTYDPAHPELSDLHEIFPDSGYWINLTQDANLTVMGMEMANTQILLAPGWNLIGYPTFTVQNVPVALNSITGDYELARTYDPVAGWMTYDPLHPEFSDLLQMAPGFGYWIKMFVPDTVII